MLKFLIGLIIVIVICVFVIPSYGTVGNHIAYAGTLTPFEPTNTALPNTSTATPTGFLQPYHTLTKTRTPTLIPTNTPNRDCGRLIYCTPTPTRLSS